MPYLKIQTNRPVEASAARTLLARASALVAKELGKPERYVMVALPPALPMLFAGTDAPCAYLELKSVGLPEGRAEALSAALCGLVESELGVAPERVYVELTNASGALWGWNRGTF